MTLRLSLHCSAGMDQPAGEGAGWGQGTSRGTRNDGDEEHECYGITGFATWSMANSAAYDNTDGDVKCSTDALFGGIWGRLELITGNTVKKAILSSPRYFKAPPLL